MKFTDLAIFPQQRPVGVACPGQNIRNAPRPSRPPGHPRRTTQDNTHRHRFEFFRVVDHAPRTFQRIAPSECPKVTPLQSTNLPRDGFADNLGRPEYQGIPRRTNCLIRQKKSTNNSTSNGAGFGHVIRSVARANQAQNPVYEARESCLVCMGFRRKMAVPSTRIHMGK